LKKVKIMIKKRIYTYLGIASVLLMLTACVGTAIVPKTENKTVPASYASTQDTVNSAQVKWKNFFSDPYLTALIDEALSKNQELNIMLQEISIAQNEIKARKGEYLPFVGLGAGAGMEKVSRYSSRGALEEEHEILPGKKFPEPLQDYAVGLNASWELDIWKKLRNAKKSAVHNYLSSVEGKNFMTTNLIAEIANSYYELLALDNQLEILKKSIEIQQNAMTIVKLQKESARATELAVKKFEAEVLKNQSHQFYLMQQITETENKINFLVGRFPQTVQRDPQTFTNLTLQTINNGIPSQLLENRPDIKQAEQQLMAAKLNVKVAKAQFYPSLRITGAAGYHSFDTKHLFDSPLSLAYTLAGDLMTPLLNRNAIKATYNSANSKQTQAVYNYERTVLNAYIEVANQLANIGNLEKSYELKSKQVEALTQSIDISSMLYRSARADYMEVLLTQRDALDSKFELIETKLQQLNSRVYIYRALGGGWK